LLGLFVSVAKPVVCLLGPKDGLVKSNLGAASASLVEAMDKTIEYQSSLFDFASITRTLICIGPLSQVDLEYHSSNLFFACLTQKWAIRGG
jgi:hypothetical protein